VCEREGVGVCSVGGLLVGGRAREGVGGGCGCGRRWRGWVGALVVW